ncbi:MAG: PGPGW domain-containing protein [Pseudomonadota bacterium]
MPIFHQALGSFLVLTGLVVLPLPIPFGLIMITIGCALLAPYVPTIQRFVKRLRTKSPDLNAWLMKYRRRFPPIIRRTIAKTHPDTHASSPSNA